MTTTTKAKKHKNCNAIRTYDNNGFKLRAGCICFKDETQKEVLLVTSSADSDLWIVPAGGIDPGETSEQAAVREVCEEAGAIGKVGECLGVFQNDASKSRTYMYTMIVKNLVEPKEKKNRKWFVLKEAIAKLNHRPVQQSYFTSAYATTPNLSAPQNNVKEQPNNKVNVYSIANLLP